MPDHRLVRLGANLKAPDPRNFRLEKYLDLSALPTVPDSVDYLGNLVFPCWYNTTIGDCVIEALAHQEQAAGAANGAEPVISGGDVLTGYEAVGGYQPGNPQTDNGCDPAAALRWWQSVGIAGNKIGAYVSVDPTNDALVRAALYLFCGLFTGLNLPLSAQNQPVWDVVGDGRSGNAAPGSWGGHMVYTGAMAKSAPHTVITWGAKQPMSPRFLATYSAQQTYAVIPLDWLNGQGKAPTGLDIAALQRDLAIVNGQPDPNPQPTPTPPPFQHDAVVDAYLEWQGQVNAFCESQYALGAVATVAAEQTVLSQYAAQLAAYMADSTKALPPLPALPA